MTRIGPSLSPEERARVLEIQDRLIDRFVAREEAIADGQERRARELQEEIHHLFEEKEEIERWAAAGIGPS